MTLAIDITIAHAMRRYLEAQINARPAARAFFRISGFSAGSYVALLEQLANQGWQLAGRGLEVRSINEIPGYPQRAMEPHRSATWYRAEMRCRRRRNLTSSLSRTPPR